MDLIRKRLVLFLTDAARKGLKALDPKSPCARALREIEVENIIGEDIERICRAASLTEVTNVLYLATQLQASSQEKKGPIKSRIKEIAGNLADRIEKESGSFKLPKSCRYLLLNL